MLTRLAFALVNHPHSILAQTIAPYVEPDPRLGEILVAIAYLFDVVSIPSYVSAKEHKQQEIDKLLAELNRDRAFSPWWAGKLEPLTKVPRLLRPRTRQRDSACGVPCAYPAVDPNDVSSVIPRVEPKYVPGDFIAEAHRKTSEARFTGCTKFCPLCTDVVVNGEGASVRTTKGVYLPVEHDCPSVRTYDLWGRFMLPEECARPKVSKARTSRGSQWESYSADSFDLEVIETRRNTADPITKFDRKLWNRSLRAKREGRIRGNN